MAPRAINSSAVSVISAATRDAHWGLVAKRSRGTNEIESNSTTSGKATGMTPQGKGKRMETLDLRTGRIQSRAEDTSANRTPSREEIRFRANELEDWLQAERELERAAPAKTNGFSMKRESQ